MGKYTTVDLAFKCVCCKKYFDLGRVRAAKLSPFETDPYDTINGWRQITKADGRTFMVCKACHARFADAVDKLFPEEE
jgi:hypothetical protein